MIRRDLQRSGSGGWALSARMADPANAWHQLWRQALPCPAAQQKPLLDAQLEGERVLHWLETLPPAALLDQLTVAALSAALAALAASDGARLPAAQRVLQRFAAAAAPVLERSGAVGNAGGSGGLQDSALEFLLAEFYYMEQARLHAWFV